MLVVVVVVFVFIIFIQLTQSVSAFQLSYLPCGRFPEQSIYMPC